MQNMCEKFRSDRLRNDRALVPWISDNNNNKNKNKNKNNNNNNNNNNNVGSALGPFPGPTSTTVEDPRTRISFLFARCRYLSIFGILLLTN